MDWKSSLEILMSKFNDFVCGFMNFGCFSGVLKGLIVFFMLFLGFKLLKFRGKFNKVSINKELLSSSVKMGCFHDDHGGTTRMKRVLCNNGCGDQLSEENSEVLASNIAETGNEDEVSDVVSLRQMVKVERRKVKAAHNELEKERMAASSSVEEAMRMILRLQSEKSALQIRVNELERRAEEKELHDQGIIQSLEWIMMKDECERSMLEEQLRLCREKLRVI